MDLAEATIDYKTKTIDMKGIPDSTLPNRLKSAFLDWIWWLALTYIIILALFQHFNITFKYQELIIAIVLLIPMFAVHSNQKMDIKIKKWFAKRTGKGKRSKLTATDFNSKEFVVYHTHNIVVEFEAKGDVAKQLAKIMTREEDPNNILFRQAKINNMTLQEKFFGQEKWWNVYFVFDEIPKDGELYIEWI